MGQKNGYFQIEIKGTHGICHVYPPQEGGEQIQFQEITNFLDSHGFKNIEVREINRLINGEQEASLDLGECDGLEFSESMACTCSLDKMQVICRVFPGTFNGNKLTVKDIVNELAARGVRFGIDQNAIMQFLANRQYCTDYVFAKGLQPVHGKDASVEYFFNTNINLQPKHNEDGSVDYHNLNTISRVEEGQLLATLHMEDRGKPGKDVFGKDLPPRSVKSMKLEFGRNIRLSEDRTQIFSEVTGHANLINGKVFVSDVYEVPGDVDNSTGNIEYNGNVHIQGSVRGGFSVIAKGDIIVEGVVEDALLQSENQIVVKCGIHGMKRGVLEAQGNIITKFIENAKVFAGGYIETGAIMYSEVSATHDVFVNEKKGFITGGTIRAGGKVEAQNIGSEMGASTVIEVGMAPDKKEEYTILQKEIKVLSEDIAKIQPVVKSYQDFLSAGKQLDKKNGMYLTKLVTELKDKKEMLQQDQEEFRKIHDEMTYANHAKIVVRRTIHAGVTVSISDVAYTMRDNRSYCQFEKKNGEIIIQNL